MKTNSANSIALTSRLIRKYSNHKELLKYFLLTLLNSYYNTYIKKTFLLNLISPGLSSKMGRYPTGSLNQKSIGNLKARSVWAKLVKYHETRVQPHLKYSPAVGLII